MSKSNDSKRVKPARLKPRRDRNAADRSPRGPVAVRFLLQQYQR